jgi:nicotinamidase-related amidase
MSNFSIDRARTALVVIDLQVLCGIATNTGVESTARAAFEHGHHFVSVKHGIERKVAKTRRRQDLSKESFPMGRAVTNNVSR